MILAVQLHEGVTLAGVHRILDLEERLHAAHTRITELEQQLERAIREMEERIEATHRQYRREIVPVKRTAVVRFDSAHYRAQR